MKVGAPRTVILYEGDLCGENGVECAHLDLEWRTCLAFEQDIGCVEGPDDSPCKYKRCEGCVHWTGLIEKYPWAGQLALEEKLIQMLEGKKKGGGL